MYSVELQKGTICEHLFLLKGFQGLENQLTALGLPGNRLHQLPVGPISILTGKSTSLHGLRCSQFGARRR